MVAIAITQGRSVVDPGRWLLRTSTMRGIRRGFIVSMALAWMACPAASIAGYDIAHIVKRTCEPRGPLIVADKWRQPRDRDQVVTEPGEVITCPTAGVAPRFQIAAGPETIDQDRYLCTYISLLNGDGADVCSALPVRSGAPLELLGAVRASPANRFALVGLSRERVASVAVSPDSPIRGRVTMVRVGARRAIRLGAAHAFGYFSIPTGLRSLCSRLPARIEGRDRSGRLIAQTELSQDTGLLDATDDVPYDRPLRSLCRTQQEAQALRTWWARVGILLRLLAAPLV